MDFNDIGRKISSAGNSVMNRAKNASVINGIKMQIAQEQKKMDSIFLAVGRKYYEMRVEETPEELKELVDQLKESENKIADLEKQCEEAKNVRFCRGCGEILGAEVVFCPHCGTKVEEIVPPPEPGTIVCPYCGSVLERGARFCNMCGKPMQQNNGFQQNNVFHQSENVQQGETIQQSEAVQQSEEE